MRPFFYPTFYFQNTGIGGGGPALTTQVADQTSVYTANMEGVYRVTKAFKSKLAFLLPALHFIVISALPL